MSGPVLAFARPEPHGGWVCSLARCWPGRRMPLLPLMERMHVEKLHRPPRERGVPFLHLPPRHLGRLHPSGRLHSRSRASRPSGCPECTGLQPREPCLVCNCVRKLPSLLSHTKLTFVALRSFSLSLEPNVFWHGSCSSCVHMSIML